MWIDEQLKGNSDRNDPLTVQMDVIHAPITLMVIVGSNQEKRLVWYVWSIQLIISKDAARKFFFCREEGKLELITLIEPSTSFN